MPDWHAVQFPQPGQLVQCWAVRCAGCATVRLLLGPSLPHVLAQLAGMEWTKVAYANWRCPRCRCPGCGREAIAVQEGYRTMPHDCQATTHER